MSIFFEKDSIHLMIDYAESCRGKANICLDEYDLKTSFVLVFRRCLQSRRIYSPQSYVFRRRLGQDQYSCLGHKSLRRVQDALSRCPQDFLKSSSKGLAKASSRHLQHIFVTSSKRLAKISSRRFQDVSLSSTVLVNTSSRRIQHVSQT